jgi:aspergillopepsin I
VALGAVSYAKQAVESAKQVSSSFSSNSASSGLLGLAFSTINTVSPTQQKTFFDNVQSSLTAPLFTADLKKGAVGSYDFGYIDSTKYTGTISYTSVRTSNGFWEFTGSGYAVGSGSFVSLSIDAIADTGTTLLLVPDSVVSAYYARVPGASYSSNDGGYIFPCSATLPSFTFGVGSYRGVIPGTYINYAPIDSTGANCFGGIQSDSGIGFSIYGDILLKAQFVIFDGGNTRLGFASKKL